MSKAKHKNPPSIFSFVAQEELLRSVQDAVVNSMRIPSWLLRTTTTQSESRRIPRFGLDEYARRALDQSWPARTAASRSSQDRTTQAPPTEPSENTSLLTDAQEDALLAHCSIVCITDVTLVGGTLAVLHNERTIVLDAPDGLADESGAPSDAWRSALAWVQALHYVAPKENRLLLPVDRLVAQLPTSGPSWYDTQTALDAGVITRNEARSMFGVGGAFITSRLPHNAILKEIGEHLTYKVIAEDGTTFREVCIAGADVRISSRTTCIRFQKLIR